MEHSFLYTEVSSALHMSARDPFVVIYLVFALSIGGIRFYFTRTMRRTRPAAKSSTWLDRAILLSAFVVMVPLTLTYLFTPALIFADFAVPQYMAWTGVALLAPTVWLFYRSHADLGSNWSMNVQTTEHHELVTHGVYAKVRHPMYASLLAAGIALLPVLHNWILGLAMLGVAILFVAVRVPYEEQFLVAQFGEAYRAYMARTGRVLPRLKLHRPGKHA